MPGGPPPRKSLREPGRGATLDGQVVLQRVQPNVAAAVLLVHVRRLPPRYSAAGSSSCAIRLRGLSARPEAFRISMRFLATYLSRLQKMDQRFTFFFMLLSLYIFLNAVMAVRVMAGFATQISAVIQVFFLHLEIKCKHCAMQLPLCVHTCIT